MCIITYTLQLDNRGTPNFKLVYYIFRFLTYNFYLLIVCYLLEEYYVLVKAPGISVIYVTCS